MKRCTTLFLSLIITIHATFAQQSQATNSSSPYHTTILKDGAIIAGGIGLTALGVSLINNKKDLTPIELATKTRDKVPFFDRSSVGYYSKKIDDASYIPFQASFVMPVLMGLINKNERQKFGQLMVLYVETMAITGTVFTMATGNVYRSRPYVYNTTLDASFRMEKNSQRAFFAGHTAATAAATFFMAKAFADFNPDSRAKPYVWAFAAAVPAVVGYMRYKAGMHFLSDNLLGYAVGAGAGILVPQLHKIKGMRNVTISPAVGVDSKGLAVTYKL
ncbi:MAG: phosphatase PAP2 family protein [Bacteroidota bacterium]|nr:phosphatase PAP2 family protein [Bacteroidota bacterium]